MSHRDNYKKALDAAGEMLAMSDGLEIRSALKQAGSDNGIPDGDAMGEFVTWAEKEMGIS